MNPDFDSKEELWIFWYLKELQDKKYVVSFQYHPKPFLLFEPAEYKWDKHGKRSIKKMSFQLLQQCTYQADFRIIWSDLAFRYFFVRLHDQIDVRNYPFIGNASERGQYWFSVIDVKGTYSVHDSFHKFSMSQKWVYQRYGIYVQKIIPVPDSKGKPASALFLKTFIPVRFRLTDKTGENRTINFPTRSLEGYINECKLLFQ